MSYLVTGGTGLVGAHVIKALIEDGEEVVAYSRAPDRILLEQLMGKEKSEQVKVVPGDVTDVAHLIRACQEQHIERIIHTAAARGDSPVEMARVNCEGTVNVLEAARVLGMKRVIITSSVAVFGAAESHKEEYISNNAPHYGMFIYGASKHFDEACAVQYTNAYKVDTIAIRFPGVYGPGQKGRTGGGLLTQELFVKPALGLPGKLPMSGPNNWLYAEDAARVEIMASRVPTTKTRAFTVSGEVRSIADVTDLVRKLIPGADITVPPPKPGMGFLSKFDTTPLKEEIGFEPEWSLERGVKKLIEFIQKYGKPATVT